MLHISEQIIEPIATFYVVQIYTHNISHNNRKLKKIRYFHFLANIGKWMFMLNGPFS